jgi:hypothetical protein
MPLSVSYGYEKAFRYFADYFAAEMDENGDSALQQELEVLHILSRN